MFIFITNYLFYILVSVSSYVSIKIQKYFSRPSPIILQLRRDIDFHNSSIIVYNTRNKLKLKRRTERTCLTNYPRKQIIIVIIIIKSTRSPSFPLHFSNRSFVFLHPLRSKETGQGPFLRHWYLADGSRLDPSFFSFSFHGIALSRPIVCLPTSRRFLKNGSREAIAFTTILRILRQGPTSLELLAQASDGTTQGHRHNFKNYVN